MVSYARAGENAREESFALTRMAGVGFRVFMRRDAG
jgi:hypothetical protein